jgi:mono/diheme cytochrome c family protein
MIQRVALSAVLIIAPMLALLWVEYAFDQPRILGWLNSTERAELQLGQNVYQTNCAACHGTNLQGEPNWQTPGADGLMPAPPHDETGHTWHHTTELLFAITKYGIVEAANLEGYQSAMPAYEGVLTDGEIEAVLSFTKSHWPEELQEQHRRLDERAQN